MRLLLREYVALLRESGELDVLIPDLLLAMGLQPLEKAQVGVRQHGVDASAVGPDPETGQLTLFLVTIKPGDVGRSDWDGSPTAVRPSLDEILDVYIPRRADSEHGDLPVRVVLCCGGNLKQDAQDNWRGYKDRNAVPSELSFDFWGGDRLALLIEEHLLDEFLFPPESQALMRKALALLDQNEEDPVSFYELAERTLFGDHVPDGTSASDRHRQVKALRLLALCLGVVVQWGLDAENTRTAVHAGERAVLRAWDALRTRGALDHAASLTAFGSVYSTYLTACRAYARRIQPLCFVRDGLTGQAGRAEPVEGPLRSFEIVGIYAALGLNYAFLHGATGKDSDGEAARASAQALAALIDNNPSSRTPLYDGHVVDVALGLLLFAMTGRTKDAAEWTLDMAHRMVAGYTTGRYFPISTDRYEDLIELERGRCEKKELMNLSTLIPTVAEFLAVLGLDEEYADFAEAMTDVFEETDFQLWFSDSSTEEALYRSNAAAETGATLSSIRLPPTAAEVRERMGVLLERQCFDDLSCIRHAFPALGLVASRHFRTPVIPAYWQRGHVIHAKG